MREKGGKSFFCYLPLAPVPLLFSLSLFFQFFTYKEGFGFAFCGGR